MPQCKPEREIDNKSSGSKLPSICIVGGRGKMGVMLQERLAPYGYVVTGLNRAAGGGYSAEEMATLLPAADIVMLSVPVTVLEGVLETLAMYLRPEQILMDMTSVKTLPMLWMEKNFTGRVVGTHPLFGPLPRPEDMRVALVRGEKADDEACALAERIFTCFGCKVFWASAREHDSGVAFAQSLNFTVSAAFFASLARQENIRPFLTPSFKRHLEAARKHLTVDTQMFLEFTSMNPEFSRVLEQYKQLIGEAAAGGLPEIARQAAGWYFEEPAKEN